MRLIEHEAQVHHIRRLEPNLIIFTFSSFSLIANSSGLKSYFTWLETLVPSSPSLLTCSFYAHLVLSVSHLVLPISNLLISNHLNQVYVTLQATFSLVWVVGCSVALFSLICFSNPHLVLVDSIKKKVWTRWNVAVETEGLTEVGCDKIDKTPSSRHWPR